MVGPPPDDPDRRVVLIYGPPGGGKTTYAHTLGLEVFDVDADRWHTPIGCVEGCPHEARFTAALAHLGRTRGARAVVIRSGARRASRARWAHLIGATLTVGTVPPLEVCIARILERNRPRPSIRRQIAAAHEWFRQYQPEPEPPGPTSRDWLNLTHRDRRGF